MRNLQECQAEVFRRSEKRIKARRKHIAMVCIPVLLCATLVSPILWPKEKAASPGTGEIAMGGLQENISESFTCSIAQITVTGAGFSRTFSGDAQVLPVWDGLSACEARAPQASGSEIKAPESADRNTETADPKYTITAGPQYTITLVMREGAPVEYLLSGDVLKNLTAEQTYALSKKEAQALYALLGISGR